jgi:hypothetical protein
MAGASTPRQVRPRAKTLIDPFELKGGLPAAYVPQEGSVAAPDATPVDTRLEELAERDAAAARAASVGGATNAPSGVNVVSHAPETVRERASTSSEVDDGWANPGEEPEPAVAGVPAGTAAAPSEAPPAVVAPSVASEPGEPGDDRLSLARRWPLIAHAPRARGWCSED